ncbi:hypothetical protein QO010_003109 [Caulobacter ginsengisoli]|uniref:Uncharacterized protein n=1 Tax=Caulobacter ginsengisoli TaxID=400775 RepID=A0ABU0ITI7_9CAUL|nr:hypothetical protein [Caulobacter ginsengisoli]MDQ0465322.1 hypothetical protein [Caulobacter ginsengisoli]
MRTKRFWIGLAAFAAMGVASAAHAESVRAKPAAPLTPDAFTVKGDFDPRAGQFGPLAARKTLQFDTKKGRWGLSLDLDQPASRDLQLKDVEAGAWFKVTPQLRVGAGVGVGSSRDEVVRKPPNKEEAPRVRLETAFKF